jgi:DNA-directed RNA polymerase specialized sigma24 family protein
VFEEQNQSGISQQGLGGGLFATTRWSLVLAAQGDSAGARAALEVMCRLYWFPIYALIRGRGADAESARDLTQEFFAKLLSHDGLATARQERGRFRSFLAQSVKNFLADQWDKARAFKRGGDRTILSLDFEAAEGRYHDQVDHASPDLLFDRRWAAQILAEARSRFEAESDAAGRGEILCVLNRLGDPDAPSLAEEAARLGLSLNTLKSHLHRARARHARIIREVVAQTVSTPAEVEAELRELLASFSD